MVWYGLCGSVLYCTVLWCAVYSVNVAVSMFLGSIILNQYAQLESMSRSHSNPIKICLIDKQYTATASLRLLHLVWNNSNLWDIRFGMIGWHNLFSNGYWFNPFPRFLCLSSHFNIVHFRQSDHCHFSQCEWMYFIEFRPLFVNLCSPNAEDTFKTVSIHSDRLIK